MFSALLFLRLTSLKNLLLSRLRRLRQPKYLIGAIVGAGYFYLVLFRRMQGGRPRGHGPYVATAVLPENLLPAIVTVGAIVLTIFVVLAWIVPEQGSGLTFSEAEIAFLFPAPVKRRTLVLYKLLSSQFAILFTALILTLLSGGWRYLQGNMLIHALGWWIILATLNLHFMGSSFAMTRLMDKGITPWRRRTLILLLMVAVGVVTVTWLRHELRPPTAADWATFSSFSAYLASLPTGGPLPWLLVPAKAVVAPFFAPNWSAFLTALGPAAVMFAIHFWWVLRLEVSFEDASVAKAERRAARVAAVREGNWRSASGALRARPGPFQLAPRGRPEIAFLWKNLLATFPIFRPLTFVVLAIIIVAGYRVLDQMPAYRGWLTAFSIIALIVGGYILFLGPQLARQDLRSDLGNADILKTYPLRGWQVVLGELLTPIAILSGLLWLVLIALFLGYNPHWPWFTPQLRIALGIGLAPLVPTVVALQLMVPNAAALLFPAWVQTMRNRTERGIEVIGQRIIFVAGQLLVVVLALLPAAALAAALWMALYAWLDLDPAICVVPAALLAFGILAVEVGLGIAWLGDRFEKFDLSAELRP